MAKEKAKPKVKTDAVCTDSKCYKHGGVKIRGQVLEATVKSSKARNTAVIEIPRIIPFTKYKRFAKAKSKFPVHNPACINAQEGDRVKIGECRKLSRTKSWTILDVVKKGVE